MTTDLPPPAVFTHGETLHAICLSELAEFLDALKQPDHLIKLLDILDRFRTPKSYHRIDVRVVESSELPLRSPADWEKAEERERGKPVILDPGISLEEFQANRAMESILNGVEDTEQMGGLDTSRGTEVNGEVTADGFIPIDPVLRDLPPPPLATLQQALSATTPYDSMAQDMPMEDTINVSDRVTYHPIHPVPPSTRLNPNPPSPTHPLAPYPEKRRVRELRLDLRTLDAAALFALETWRRQALKLEKLNMDVPDSIWYRDPSPTPPPPTPFPPRVTTIPKRRGRPPKKAREEKETVSENYQSLLEALNTNGVAYEIAEETRQEDLAMPEETILNALDELARQEDVGAGGSDLDAKGEDDIGIDAPNIAGPTESQSEMEETAVSPQLVGGGGSTPKAEPLSSARSPSADIILPDAFNEKEERDPDFAPRRRTRSSTGSMEAVQRKRRTGRSSRRDSEPSGRRTSPAANAKSGPSRHKRKQPFEVLVFDSRVPIPVEDSSIQTGRRRGRSAPTSNTSPIQAIEAELVVAPTSSITKKRKQVMESVEIPTTRRRIRRPRTSAASEKNVRFADETPEKGIHLEPEGVSGGSGVVNDGSGDEWDFLKGF